MIKIEDTDTVKLKTTATGNDTVHDGGPGHDRVLRRPANDRLIGHNGSDRLYGGRGHDVRNGGPGERPFG